VLPPHGVLATEASYFMKVEEQLAVYIFHQHHHDYLTGIQYLHNTIAEFY